jgi:hypothetical protein
MRRKRRGGTIISGFTHVGNGLSAKVLFIALSLMAYANATAWGDSMKLSGPMSRWQGGVGAWICDVTIQPTRDRPPQKWSTFATGSVAPNNVFHWSEIASGIEADQFDGYSLDKKFWWEAQADSTGYATVLRSPDGTRFTQVSIPSRLEDDQSRYREVYTFAADGTFHVDVERFEGGSWRFYSSSSCKRTSSSSVGHSAQVAQFQYH